jgi:site-specific recombinase XerD
LIVTAGPAARFAWEEFLHGAIRNPHTRRSYARAAQRFAAWCECQGIGLVNVAPADVGRYLDGLPNTAASKKVYLSALRHLFDLLVQRHAVILNPAASVRGERLEVIEGRTPEISVEQARALLNSLDTSHPVGLRDKSIIAILIYTAARVGALARLRIRDYYDVGDQYCLRFLEKGGKSREIPVRHDLRLLVGAYLTSLEVSSLGPSPTHPDNPLFTSAIGRTMRLTSRAMSADDVSRMVRRRMRDAGLPLRFTAHSFRVATITDLLTQGVPLEDVQNLAGHADPRTTRLYDRRHRRVTRNIVERISI